MAALLMRVLVPIAALFPRTLVPIAIVLLRTAVAGAQAWAPEERVTVTTTDSETGLSRNPMAVDSRGDLHVVWCEQDGPASNYQIHSRRRRIAGWDLSRIAVPYLASYPGTGVGAKYPSLVIDSQDSLHMAWHDYRIAGIQNIEIYFKSRGIDASWDTSGSADIRLTTSDHPETNGDNGYLPSLVQDRQGLLCVAWYDYRYDGQNAEILFKARSGGAWDLAPGDGADLRLCETAANSIDPAVAVDSSGNVYAVWAEQGGGVILCRRRSAATGLWGSIETVNLGGNAVGSPAAAADPQGALHVLWTDAREGSQAVYARSRAAGGAWGAERRVGPGGKNAQEPAIAAAADSRLYAAWHDTRISLLNREVFLQERAPGGTWDTTGAADVRISNGTGHSTRPSLLIDRFGSAYVLWKDRRDGNNELYLRIRRNQALTAVGGAAGDPAAGAPGDGAPAILARVAPNPVSGAAAWFLTIPRAGDLDVRVHDVSGREVCRLWSGPAEAGEIARAWDARDASGRALPAGVYFLRATLGMSRGAARVILVGGGER
jgi:hypothetical protein